MKKTCHFRHFCHREESMDDRRGRVYAHSIGKRCARPARRHADPGQTDDDRDPRGVPEMVPQHRLPLQRQRTAVHQRDRRPPAGHAGGVAEACRKQPILRFSALGRSGKTVSVSFPAGNAGHCKKPGCRNPLIYKGK